MPKTVDKSEQIGLFPFPPTGNGNDQPCQLLQIKYELKLPSEVILVLRLSDSDPSSVNMMSVVAYHYGWNFPIFFQKIRGL